MVAGVMREEAHGHCPCFCCFARGVEKVLRGKERRQSGARECLTLTGIGVNLVIMRLMAAFGEA